MQDEINGTSGNLILNSNYKMAIYEKNNFTGKISIYKDITINGNGFTIDGGNFGRIFYICDCIVTLY